MLSRRVSIIRFSRVISRVRWFSLVETNVPKTISVLVLRVVEIIWVRDNPVLLFIPVKAPFSGLSVSYWRFSRQVISLFAWFSLLAG
jgi:hypothetical protein